MGQYVTIQVGFDAKYINASYDTFGSMTITFQKTILPGAKAASDSKSKYIFVILRN